MIHTSYAKPNCSTCGGSGQIPNFIITPECCGNLNEQGECCNNPIPVQDVFGSERCPECETEGEIIDEQIQP